MGPGNGEAAIARVRVKPKTREGAGGGLFIQMILRGLEQFKGSSGEQSNITKIRGWPPLETERPPERPPEWGRETDRKLGAGE